MYARIQVVVIQMPVTMFTRSARAMEQFAEPVVRYTTWITFNFRFKHIVACGARLLCSQPHRVVHLICMFKASPKYFTLHKNWFKFDTNRVRHVWLADLLIYTRWYLHGNMHTLRNEGKLGQKYAHHRHLTCVHAQHSDVAKRLMGDIETNSTGALITRNTRGLQSLLAPKR